MNGKRSGGGGGIKRVKKKGLERIKKLAKWYKLVIIGKDKDNPKLLYAYIKSQQQTIESIKAFGLGNGEIVTDSKAGHDCGGVQR